MNNRVFIGVDGGGTKTKVIAIDEHGNILGESVGDGINFYTTSMDQTRQNLKAIIDDLINKTNIVTFDSLYIGMSALDGMSPIELLEEFCGDTFDQQSTVMISDVLAGLFGLTLGKPGIMIISGTGMMGAALDADGSLHVIGGWGYILGDEGSCFNIGQEGIKAGIRDYEGTGEHTELSQRMFDYYGIQNIRDLIKLIYTKEKVNDIIAGFAQEVILAYRHGDSVANKILKQALDLLVTICVNLVDQIGIEGTKVGVYGGLFEKNQDIFERFRSEVKHHRSDVNVIFPQILPEIGAILYGIQENRIDGWKEITNNIVNTFYRKG